MSVNKDTTTFILWLKELREMAVEQYGFTDPDFRDEEAWLAYYNDGYTPEGALDIECSYD